MSDYRALASRVGLALVKALFALTMLAIVLLSLGLTTQIFTKPIASRLVIEINALTTLNISYEDIEGVPISDLHVRGLAFQAGSQQFKAEDVELVWNPFQLFSGIVDIATLKLSGVSLVIDNSTPESETSNEPSLSTIDPLGIEISLSEFIVNGFTIHYDDQVVTLDTLQAGLEVNDQAMTLSGLFARYNEDELNGSLRLEIGNSPILDADLAWYSPSVVSFVPASVLQLLPQLRGEIPSGQILINGWTEELNISHSLNTPVALSSTGTLSSPLSLSELSFAFEHAIASVDLENGTETTTLNELSITTTGNIDSQRIQTSASIADARLSALDFSADGILSGSNLRIDDIEIRTTTGASNANINIGFAEAVQISGNYTLEDTAPLDLFTAATPFELTNLSSQGDFNASLDSETWNGRLQVIQIIGDLSGYPLNGNAAISILNNTPVIEHLRLATSDNSLSIAGNLSNEAGVSWSLQAPALNQLLPDASGSMNGSGTLSNAGGSIKIAGSLNANAVKYQTYYGDAINVTFDFNEDLVSAKVLLQNIGSAETNDLISSANLDLRGNPNQHTLSGILNSPYLNLNSALQGSLIQTDSSWEWTGALTTAELNSSYGMWQLQSALQISLSNSFDISVNGGCFTQSGTRLCTTVEGNLDETLEAQLSLEGLQLSRFNQNGALSTSNDFITPTLPLLPPGFLVEGVVTSRLLTTLSTSSPLIELSIDSEGTSFTIDPSQFADAEELSEENYERQSYQIDRFSIAASGSLDSLRLSSLIEINEISLNDEPLAAPGRINSQLLISNLQNLDGDVQINLPSLDWVEAVISGASNVQGGLVSNISIAGTIEQPTLGGNIEFTNLAFDVDALGIQLFDVNLSAQQKQNNSYLIQGSLSSSEGSAAVTGQVQDFFLPTWSADAQITGSNFLFINRPELTMAASPDLKLKASGQLIDVQGQLGVPKLQLDIEGLPDTAIDVSRDVVITQTSTTANNQDINVYVDERSLFAIPISADVNVVLENDVGFSGFGITAKLDGDINYRQSATGASSTYGELSILSGSYQAYRQELIIKQGQLLFFGALDNPALDIRAIREVDGVTVGVLMNGTLKSINSQLFSTPALPENDIISLIATGRKFSSIGEGDGVNVLNTIANLGLNRSQGLTNSMRDKLGLDALQITNTGDINNSVLTVGKYVTPDIFIRYGVGLFDNQSKISVDYTLSEHIKLQAESGEFQSIDITYTVEK